MTLTSYTKLHQKQRDRSVELCKRLPRQKGNDSPTGYVTWQINYSQLGQSARALLELCSCLDYRSIYSWMFAEAAVNSVDYHPDKGFENVGLRSLYHLKNFFSLFLAANGRWD